MADFKRVTVVGCGLIGASFALALRRSGACESILGWDVSPSALEEALSLGVIDGVDSAWERGAESASDLVYLAMPVGGIVRFLREGAGLAKPGAVITDAGSTKLEVCRAARAYLPEGRQFVGGHPMAGCHLSGPSHASAALLDGATYVLTPCGGVGDGRALERVKGVVEMLGARAVLMGADEHDRVVAWVSHLPQLLSSVLAATVNGHEEGGALLGLAGGGYKGMTRLAQSSWDVWRDIVATNAGPVAEALGTFSEHLAAVRDEVLRLNSGGGAEAGLTRDLFARAQRTPATPARADSETGRARAASGRPGVAG